MSGVEAHEMGNAKDLLEGIGRAIGGDTAELERVSSPDIEFTDSMQHVHGTEALRRYLQTWSTAFPDGRTELKNIVESGDQAAGELVYQGTQTGPMSGPQGEIPPTGKSVHILGSAWITHSAGKITSFRGYYDTMAMMVQLGLMPAPAPA
jgi:predicted ester cyclase